MGAFLKEVNKRIDGIPIQNCYHCRKCTAGCPIVFSMEYSPDQIIKMVQMEMKGKVLNSSAIWFCASCETCVTRCPNNVDIARMMDVLREMAVESGAEIKEKKIMKFHEAFLANVKLGGRVNETLMIVNYKLKTGDYFSDVGIGMSMFMKGKLSLLSPKTKDMKSVKRIFEKTKK